MMNVDWLHRWGSGHKQYMDLSANGAVSVNSLPVNPVPRLHSLVSAVPSVVAWAAASFIFQLNKVSSKPAAAQ